MKFLIGLAHRMAGANGVVDLPAVQEKLGELASPAAVVEGLVVTELP